MLGIDDVADNKMSQNSNGFKNKYLNVIYFVLSFNFLVQVLVNKNTVSYLIS